MQDEAAPEAMPDGPILLSAKLFAAEGRMLVMLLELTADAVIATTAAPPPVGSVVVVSRNGVRTPATVAWADGRRLGLALEQPLPDSRRRQFLGIRPEAPVDQDRTAAAA